ncbi:MAG: UDP-N-acetylmuramoyl-L-alanine--D-glutamate ligase [Acidobacteriota bacterium]|nr:UDP-N-acetylmuramoyl-L-alanine--D-glutamate ligase [Acidobacteriota bacterium]
MSEFSVAGRRVTVVGAARSGIAAAELLRARGARVTLTDLRPAIDEGARLERLGVTLALGGHPAGLFDRSDLIVLSPGVPGDRPDLARARAAGVPVIGELELASRWLQGRVIAVTGTKGKSTTTALIGRILQAGGRAAVVGGNIGVPLSAQVAGSTASTIHVVETSSFQLEETETFHPWIAVLLNFSTDHLDRHGTVEAYAAAKRRIFANQTPADWAVVNADDPAVLAMAAGGRAPVVRFALDAPLADGFVVGDGWIVRVERDAATPLVPLSAIHLIGRHLVNDVLAAVAVGTIAGVPAAAMTAAIDGFAGLEHAMERAGTVGRVRFVNDSKATNIEAARRAIESVERGLVPILGGRFKGGDFRGLRDALAGRARAVVAIGEAAPLVREALGDLLPVHDAGSMDEAVRVAFEAAGPEGTVLLAPACASFDMFRDYAERGRRFKEAVARLADPAGP